MSSGTAGESLRAWLQYLRIDKYYDQLHALGLDARSLAELSDEALAEIGLPLGPRKKIRLNAGLMIQSCGPAQAFEPQSLPVRSSAPLAPAVQHGPHGLPPSVKPGLADPQAPCGTTWAHQSHQLKPALSSGPGSRGAASSMGAAPASGQRPTAARPADPNAPASVQQQGAPCHGRWGRGERSNPSGAAGQGNRPQNQAAADRLQTPITSVPSDPLAFTHQQKQKQGSDRAGPQQHALPQQPRLPALGNAPASGQAVAEPEPDRAEAVSLAEPAAVASELAGASTAGRDSGAGGDAGSARSYATAAAERRALARLYPDLRDLGRRGPPDLEHVDRSGLASEGGRGSRPGAGIGIRDRAVVHGSLSVRGRGVLKRSRSWDGGGGLPDSTERGAQQRQTIAAGLPGLYDAAASARPVDCSFRAIRDAAKYSRQQTSDVLKADGVQPAQQLNGPQQLAPPLPSDRSEPPGPSGRPVDPLHNGPAVGEAGELATQHYGSGAQRHPDHALQPSGSSAGGGLTRSAAAGAGPGPGLGPAEGSDPRGPPGSLLDDPRNYETPELLAQLLYEEDTGGQAGDAAGIAGPGTAAADESAATTGADRFLGGSSGPGGAVGRHGAGLEGLRAGPSGDAGNRPLGGAAGGEVVTRELRLARLRALRQEVAETERLLETLRRMVAEEEAALAASGGPRTADAGAAAARAPQAAAAHGVSRRGEDDILAPLAQQERSRGGYNGGGQLRPEHQEQQQQRAGTWLQQGMSGGQLHMHSRQRGLAAASTLVEGLGDQAAATATVGSEGSVLAAAGRRESTDDRFYVAESPREEEWEEQGWGGEGAEQDGQYVADYAPTQRWDSGMMLTERLELLA